MRIAILFAFVFLHGPQSSSQNKSLPADTQIVSTHEITIRGQKVSYEATTGTQPVWNEKGKAEAAVHYTYYRRTNAEPTESRPLIISFNGGPGAGSVWMHLGYTGPYVLKVDEEGYPIQPYGIKPNEHSVLDKADLLYVNPVGTGYSRVLADEYKREKYFGVNADINYLASWIQTFVTRQNRWLSPKFLIGESYGTTRVSGLALQLQNAEWMYLNGVVLVSPTGLGIDRDGPVAAANRLPYFAATAWYHEKLDRDLQNQNLTDLLEEVETYTLDKLLPLMSRGGFISPSERMTAAKVMSRYSGISKKQLLQHNLDLSYTAFWKSLLREEGYTVGRLDSRYLGIDKMKGGSRPDYYAELTSWLHAFTPPLNHYFRNVLGFHTDVKYQMLGNVRPWNRSRDRTGENLRQAMAQNPFLKVMVQSGYFDGATTYFNAKYTLWHLDPSGRMRDRLRFEGYESGHMMYLRKPDLKDANDHLRSFIDDALPVEGEPAQYKRMDRD
ncbi:MAG: carboxypeptidase [Bacteroidetes bacterium]|jgi:carboxypeptidase C (cathepsin A)|nr:carboxypeptidase [Bacteroidota bacterium]